MACQLIKMPVTTLVCDRHHTLVERLRGGNLNRADPTMTVIELTQRGRFLFRFQDDSRPLPHFQLVIRVNEQRLLERRFADQQILNPRNHFVAGPLKILLLASLVLLQPDGGSR
jgi:hypothetical protein